MRQCRAHWLSYVVEGWIDGVGTEDQDSAGAADLTPPFR